MYLNSENVAILILQCECYLMNYIVTLIIDFCFILNTYLIN